MLAGFFYSPLFICVSHSPVSPQVPFLASSCRMKRSPHSCFFLGGGEEKTRQTTPPSFSPFSIGSLSPSSQPFPARPHVVRCPPPVVLLCGCLTPAHESPRSRRPAGAASAPQHPKSRGGLRRIRRTSPASPGCQPRCPKKSCTSGWVARGEHAGERTGRI